MKRFDLGKVLMIAAAVFVVFTAIMLIAAFALLGSG
jgi:hypothetical protein